KPSPIAISGMMKLRAAVKEIPTCSGSSVKMRRKRYELGSTTWRRVCSDVATGKAPKAMTNSISTIMRALLRWSANSLTNTGPMPVNGEPSRRLERAALGGMARLLEIACVDFLEAGLQLGEPGQRAAGTDDAPRHLGPHVAVGHQ